MADNIRNLVAGLSERERRMAAVTGLVAIGFFIFLFVFFVQSRINDMEEETEEYAKSLSLIMDKEQSYLDKRRERQRNSSKGMVKPTPLRTLIDKIGKHLSVTVPDMKELPDQRHSGGHWLEHSVELSMREIGMADLTKFMEEVEGNRRKFPIAITKLEIRKRKRTPDAYDVKMVIATYERAAEETTPGKRPHGVGRKGGR
ncbi:MAG: hypothetical protein GY847_05345 [Proteobacteria bacterium]|nr:hypothetical protein [Pseudomonadota bacterium]